ncbi:MAG: dihydrofolate reductase [Flavobacteriales bacterium]|jgi:dihydrofolate reductase|nr:dihydrofolate reductase [Flavobacteriales bacterium]
MSTPTTPSVVLYISMSLDGYITTKDDDLGWLEMVNGTGEDYGYFEMKSRMGSYIVGRKTYDVVRNLCNGEFPAANDFDCYIITRQSIPNKENITFFNGDVADLIKELKAKSDKDIYCDGGGEVVRLLMDQNLIDEYIISIIPTILGDGKRLFLGEIGGINIEAISTTKYNSGLIQVHYKRNLKPKTN